MELLASYDTLFKVTVNNPEMISDQMLKFLYKMWEMGYAHGDFNEFNVMVDDKNVKIIDFPQCISTKDPRAIHYLKRDIECVQKYFWKKNRFFCNDSIFQDIFKGREVQIEVQRNGVELVHKGI
jgi:RIO kinase 2